MNTRAHTLHFMDARAQTLPFTWGSNMAQLSLALSLPHLNGRSQYFVYLFQDHRCVSTEFQSGFFPRNNPESVKILQYAMILSSQTPQ